MALHYLIGDATEPIKRPAIICHCCNNIGGWGRGFVISLSKKYPEAEKEYRKWFDTDNPELGDVQFVYIQNNPDICVANLIGQQGIRWQGKIPPIRYDAIARGLERVYMEALAPHFRETTQEQVSIHMPRMGSVLAGGDWNRIEELIKRAMGSVETYVYTLESQRNRWPSNH